MKTVNKDELIKQIEIDPGMSGLLIINAQQIDPDMVKRELLPQIESAGYKGLVALCDGDVRSAVKLHVVSKIGDASPSKGGDVQD